MPEFLTWALETLKEANKNEVLQRSAILAAQYKEILSIRSDLDNPMRSRYRGEINDKTFFTSERNALQVKLKRLQESSHDTEERAEKWLELTERTFNFAIYAQINFNKGDLKTKKEVLIALEPVSDLERPDTGSRRDLLAFSNRRGV